MNIVILNQYCENRGDEAAGEALIEDLLAIFNVSRIDVIYNSAFKLNIDNPKVFHRNQDLLLKKIGTKAIGKYLILRKTFFKKYACTNPTLKEMIRTISSADYVFVTPCGASIGIYKDWPFLIRILFTVFEGKTPIFYLDTIGKSNDVVFDMVAKYALKKSIVYVRERASFNYLKSIGVDSKVGVDTAFSRKPIYSKRKSKSIGFITTLLGWHPDFKNTNVSDLITNEIIPGISEFCLINDLSIDLIPHIGNKEELDFLIKIAASFKNNGLSGDAVKICRDIKTASEYDNIISTEEVIIGMRYHSIVLAAKNAVPFLSIAYENKMKEVCWYTGFSDNCLDLHKKISRSDVFDYLTRIYSNSNQITSKLKHEYQKLHDLALLPLEQISYR